MCRASGDGASHSDDSAIASCDGFRQGEHIPVFLPVMPVLSSGLARHIKGLHKLAGYSLSAEDQLNAIESAGCASDTICRLSVPSLTPVRLRPAYWYLYTVQAA